MTPVNGRRSRKTNLETHPRLDLLRQHLLHDPVKVAQDLHGQLWLDVALVDKIVDCVHQRRADPEMAGLVRLGIEQLLIPVSTKIQEKITSMTNVPLTKDLGRELTRSFGRAHSQRSGRRPYLLKI